MHFNTCSVFLIACLATTSLTAEIRNKDFVEEKVQTSDVSAEKEEIEQHPLAAAQSTDLDPSTQLEEEDEENKRAKKSTTTTFCVEIRPSGPYQKPFQVCEPATPEAKQQQAYAPQQQAYAQPAAPSSYQPEHASKTAPSNSAPYPAPVVHEYTKSEPAKAAPAYAAPVKTYSAPAIKQYPEHAPNPYSSSFRNTEDQTEDAQDKNEESEDTMMRVTEDTPRESFESSEMVDANTRFAHSGLGQRSYGGAPSYGGSPSYGGAPSYGAPPSYGGPAPVSYVPVKPAYKKKAHSGLVITCQPNLAGYAHDALPHGGYRSAGYGGYYGYAPHRQAPAYKPAAPAYAAQQPYKPQAAYGAQPVYKAPSYAAPPAKPQGYAKPAVQSYSAPTQQSYSAPAQPSYSAPAQPSYSAPAQQSYAAPAQPSYPAPAQSGYSAPPQAPAYTAPVAPAPAPSYSAPAPTAPVHTSYSAPAVVEPAYEAPQQPSYAAPPAYSAPSKAQQPAQSYSAPGQSYAQSSAHAQSYAAPAQPAYAAPAAQSYGHPAGGYAPAKYTPPQTYRDAEEDTQLSPEDKEIETLKKMEKIALERASGSKWASEMAAPSETQQHAQSHAIAEEETHTKLREDQREEKGEHVSMGENWNPEMRKTEGGGGWSADMRKTEDERPPMKKEGFKANMRENEVDMEENGS